MTGLKQWGLATLILMATVGVRAQDAGAVAAAERAEVVVASSAPTTDTENVSVEQMVSRIKGL